MTVQIKHRIATKRNALQLPNRQPELWAGIEPTVNRVGDTFFDQIERSGHADRLSDLDLLAGLGVQTLRYPVLWERTAPNGLASADWNWADQRLARLRELGIRPIVGLVHHGSGPRHTSLVDADFASGLARYARAVAMRYPWITHYTPVNEPLTTARFSGLYGHWYPHGRDTLTFCRALLNQCRAVVLAMQAIREINPAAQLVQTEDLGKTFATPALHEQAEFENQRRWITFDLLCGRVDHHHPMFHYMRSCGVDAADIDWFQDNPCPPDIFGINYYLTSERFLDEDYTRYPPETIGGNGRQTYADVEAVRVRRDGLVGPGRILQETWERYCRPLAITEAHLACTREEQARWLLEVWQTARDLRAAGIDIRAVTAWSALGAYDWNSLVTRADSYYEPGLFDLRSRQPRPTATAAVVTELAAGRVPDQPLFHLPGWWHRPLRLIFGFAADEEKHESDISIPHDHLFDEYHTVQPLLITDAETSLGRATAYFCEIRGIPYTSLGEHHGGAEPEADLDAVLRRVQPWAIVHTAHTGTLTIDTEHGPALAALLCRTIALGEACRTHGARLLTFSSDLVFDGRQEDPYLESDPLAPVTAAGRAVAVADDRILAILPSALVIRTGPLFSPWDESNLVIKTLQAMTAGEQVHITDNRLVSSTFVPDLIQAALDLLVDGEQGLWHVVNADPMTPGAVVREAARLAAIEGEVCAGTEGEMTIAPGAGDTRILGSERGTLLPSLSNALARYIPSVVAEHLQAQPAI